MKNLLKYPILVSVIAISACKSHKPVEAFHYSANDSCLVQSNLSVNSFVAIEKNETISSRLAQDHMEFSEGAGEIIINSNGEISIKGLNSADLIRHDTHKQSITAVSTNDSITVQTQAKTAKATDTTSKAVSANPTVSSTWQKILLFIAFIIIVILSFRFLLKRFFN
ncbi:MAG: hypothetical protein K2K75_06200 [Muribaculaceae bacterium]|nr:hypothetical protein [Muribaculaceae bacterium]